MFGIDGSSGYERIDRLDDLGAQPIAQDPLDLVVDEVAHRRVVGAVLDHVLAHDADAQAGERLAAWLRPWPA